MPKFLIIRLSSIGDIVLTSPVIRCLKKQIPDAEIHFLTGSSYKPVLKENPYIDKLWTTDGSLKDVLPDLQKENFSEIFDLHYNLRTFKIKKALNIRSKIFPKLNIEKWLLVNFKINWLPSIHIVDRYFSTVKHLDVKNDGEGLDYFIHEQDVVSMDSLPPTHKNKYFACVIGARHATKIMPTDKIIAYLKLLDQPVILLGGPEDSERGEIIRVSVGSNVFNACGMYRLNQSASLINQATAVITHDTGLMHIAAAYNKAIVSIWGNTVPEFGMTPYLTGNNNLSAILEIKNLYCRPCSKIGFQNCPEGHFRCMNDIKEEDIVDAINKISAK